MSKEILYIIMVASGVGSIIALGYAQYQLYKANKYLYKTKMNKEELDNFLLKLLNADKVGIRRKLIAMKNFLEENTILLNQNKDESN